MLHRSTSGVFAIAPTPFDALGAIDNYSIDLMVERYEAAGVNGITILGVMGEATKLDAAETFAVTSRVLKRAKTAEVVVGVSASGFATMRSIARHSMEEGAAGVLIAPPSTVRTDEQIVNFFREAASVIGDDVPFALQDYPLATGVVLSVDVISRIFSEISTCVMLKHEDCPGLDKMSAIRAREAAGSLPELSIFVGNGGSFLDFELERGADGAMTGYAFPEMLVDIVRFGKSGEREHAHDLFDAHLPLIRYELQPGGVGLAVRKYILQRRGFITSAHQRQPAGKLTEVTRSEVDYLLQRLSRHDKRAALSN